MQVKGSSGKGFSTCRKGCVVYHSVSILGKGFITVLVLGKGFITVLVLGKGFITVLVLGKGFNHSLSIR